MLSPITIQSSKQPFYLLKWTRTSMLDAELEHTAEGWHWNFPDEVQASTTEPQVCADMFPCCGSCCTVHQKLRESGEASALGPDKQPGACPCTSSARRNTRPRVKCACCKCRDLAKNGVLVGCIRGWGSGASFSYALRSFEGGQSRQPHNQ